MGGLIKADMTQPCVLSPLITAALHCVHSTQMHQFNKLTKYFVPTELRFLLAGHLHPGTSLGGISSLPLTPLSRTSYETARVHLISSAFEMGKLRSI